MKKLSDYKGEDALELWGDLLEPITAILQDNKVISAMSGKASPAGLAKLILKDHKTEAEQILLRIDDTPINGLNIVLRLISFLTELDNAAGFKDFFGYAEQGMDSVSSGSASENIAETEAM